MVPLLSPVIVAVVPPVVVALTPPGVAVIVYPLIVDPPSLNGAVQDTKPCASPAVAATPVGAPGAVLGVTAALDNEAARYRPRWPRSP